MFAWSVQIISGLGSQSKFQMFTLFSGRHVGVRYTSMAASYFNTLVPEAFFLGKFCDANRFYFFICTKHWEPRKESLWSGILTFMPDQLLTVVSDWRIFMKVYLWQNSITRDRYQIIQIVHASIQSWIATSRFYDPNLECIQPKLKGKTPFQVSCSQSKCRKAYWMVKGITQKGITRKGITRKGITQKGKW